MPKVALQMVEQAGVNVNELLDKLVRAASAEFTTYYYYTILRVNAIGLEGELTFPDKSSNPYCSRVPAREA